MFDALSDRLERVAGRLRGRGRLSDADLDEALHEIRNALLEAVEHDSNPGVRLKSLDALKGYVRDDVHVRDAVVEALLHDNNAGVRQEAISLLDVVKADTSVRSALTVLADRDPNKFIREESKRYLASMPHLD